MPAPVEMEVVGDEGQSTSQNGNGTLHPIEQVLIETFNARRVTPRT